MLQVHHPGRPTPLLAQGLNGTRRLPCDRQCSLAAQAGSQDSLQTSSSWTIVDYHRQTEQVNSSNSGNQDTQPTARKASQASAVAPLHIERYTEVQRQTKLRVLADKAKVSGDEFNERQALLLAILPALEQRLWVAKADILAELVADANELPSKLVRMALIALLRVPPQLHCALWARNSMDAQ